MSSRELPSLRHMRREALLCAGIWALATITVTTLYRTLGYSTPERPLGPDDLRPIAGIPFWFVWAILVPWGISAAIGICFALFVLTDDSLGADHALELEREIHDHAAEADAPATTVTDSHAEDPR